MTRLSAAEARCAGYGNQLPPADALALTCACGCVYLDYPAGLDAHEAVHGHAPGGAA